MNLITLIAADCCGLSSILSFLLIVNVNPSVIGAVSFLLNVVLTAIRECRHALTMPEMTRRLWHRFLVAILNDSEYVGRDA